MNFLTTDLSASLGGIKNSFSYLSNSFEVGSALLTFEELTYSVSYLLSLNHTTPQEHRVCIACSVD